MARENRSERQREPFFAADAVPAVDPGATPVASIADRALNDIARSLKDRLRAGAVVIAVEFDGEMTCRARAGAAAPDIGTPVERHVGLTGECVSTGVVIRCADTRSDPRVDAALCEELRIRSILLVPLLRRGRVLGVVEAFFPTRYGFDDRTVHTLQDVATDIVTRICGPDEPPVATLEPQRPAVSIGSPGPPSVESHEEHVDTGEASGAPGPEQSMPFETPEPQPAFDPAPEFHLQTESSSRGRIIAMVVAVLIVLAIAAILYERHRNLSPATNRAGLVSADQPADSLADLRQAAQAGDTAAQYRLSQAYRSGSGVAADPQQANAWLKTAAEHGNADAQFEWAHALETGKDADLVEAYTWYVIAGQSGKTESEPAIRRLTPNLSPADIAQVRYRVGDTILAGRALRRDPVAAYVWFALAEWGGDSNARGPIQQLETELTPAELRDAKSRASTWIRRHSAPPAQKKANPSPTAFMSEKAWTRVQAFRFRS